MTSCFQSVIYKGKLAHVMGSFYALSLSTQYDTLVQNSTASFWLRSEFLPLVSMTLPNVSSSWVGHKAKELKTPQDWALSTGSSSIKISDRMYEFCIYLTNQGWWSSKYIQGVRTDRQVQEMCLHSRNVNSAWTGKALSCKQSWSISVSY